MEKGEEMTKKNKNIPPSAISFSIEDREEKIIYGYIWNAQGTCWVHKDEQAYNPRIQSLNDEFHNILTLKFRHPEEINHPDFAIAKKQIEKMKEDENEKDKNENTM